MKYYLTYEKTDCIWQTVHTRKTQMNEEQ